MCRCREGEKGKGRKEGEQGRGEQRRERGRCVYVWLWGRGKKLSNGP